MTVVEGAGIPARLPARLLLLLAAAYAAKATAGVEFKPTVAVGIANTDNVNLVPDNPQTATIYELLPGFTLTQDSMRMHSEVDYHVEAYRYQELKDTDVFENFKGVTRFALDPDNFFLDLGATRDQSIRDPEVPIPLTNLGRSTNRVDRDDYYVLPSFRYPFGQDATARGSVRHDEIHYGDAADFAIPDYSTDSLEFSLDNYRKARGATWAFKYNTDRTVFSQFQPWEHRQAAIEIGGWVTRGLRLFASAGRESPWDDLTDTSLKDPFWEVGFATDPDRSLSMEIATGERAFGTSRRASLRARFAHGRTSLQYTEKPITQGYDYQRDLVLGLAGTGLYDFLNRPGAAEQFLSKMLSWSMDIDMRRLTFSAAFFDESREHRVSLAGVPLEDETQAYVDLGIGWRPRANTDFRLGAQNSHRELGPVAYSLKSHYINVDHRLGRKTSLQARLTRTTGESQSAVEYRFNLIELTLTRRLSN